MPPSCLKGIQEWDQPIENTLLRQRAHAQILAEGLDVKTSGILWAASVDMANTLENITSTTKSAMELHSGQQSKLYPYFLKELG
jgi:hypothetical protein